MKEKILNQYNVVRRRLVLFIKDFWHLNWEAKIGLVFLIPPIWGVFVFIFTQIGEEICWDDFYHYGNYTNATSAKPIYMGLMAIAGAYLIKGNLKKKE